ncbi:hypothetical protein HanIR_Chr14g0726581 [Helianthus annuus]|nr:hypothetical protein HanIR_Chr14g0726581 [Helianthus annuus]
MRREKATVSGGARRSWWWSGGGGSGGGGGESGSLDGMMIDVCEREREREFCTDRLYL